MYSKEEKKKLTLKFWELFATRCAVHPELKIRNKKWVLHRTKIKGVALRFDINREESNQEVCRIYTVLENVDLHKQNQWPNIYNFFIENMIKLEESFISLSEVLLEELKN